MIRKQKKCISKDPYTLKWTAKTKIYIGVTIATFCKPNECKAFLNVQYYWRNITLCNDIVKQLA